MLRLALLSAALYGALAAPVDAAVVSLDGFVDPRAAYSELRVDDARGAADAATIAGSAGEWIVTGATARPGCRADGAIVRCRPRPMGAMSVRVELGRGR